MTSASTWDGPPVKILRNAPGLQAVLHEELHIAGLAFYEPGEVEIRPGWTVAVDTPCLVLLKETTEKLGHFRLKPVQAKNSNEAKAL